MRSQSDSVKDRNGVDIYEGDVVSFLRGSTPRGTAYETSAVVLDIDVRARRIVVNSGDTLYWHEVWKED